MNNKKNAQIVQEVKNLCEWYAARDYKVKGPFFEHSFFIYANQKEVQVSITWLDNTFSASISHFSKNGHGGFWETDDDLSILIEKIKEIIDLSLKLS